MAPLGYLEILDGKGSVLERVAIDAFPVKIGRAYSNRVILNDPYVCPVHLEITLDGEGRLTARDLDSVNGLRADNTDQRVASLELHSGTQFRIGRSRLRYCSVDHPLAPTVIDGAGESSRWSAATLACLSGAAVFLLLCLDSYLGIVEHVTAAKVVSEPLATFSMLIIWSGLWSLAGRIVVNHFYFPRHVTVACGAIVGFYVLTFVSEWLEFLFPIIPALWIAGLLGTGVILAALVYGHLAFASSLRRYSRFWAALAVSVAVLGVSVISDFAGRSKFSNVMEFSGVLKPIDAAWLPTISIDQFIEDTQKLKRDLDALAHKAKPAQP